MVFIALTTVFAGLTALVGLIAVAARLLGRFQPETRESSTARAEPTQAARAAEVADLGSLIAKCEASEEELRRVALAAVSVHRMRRANRVPTARRSTWVSAGRTRQIAPFSR